MEKTTIILALDEKRKWTVTIPDDVRVNPEKIDKELSDQPALFAWWAHVAVLFAAEKQRVEAAYDECRAAEDSVIRRRFEAAGEKLTEARLEKLIDSSEVIRGLREKLIVATENANMAQAIKEAVYQRKESLVSLAANMRAEIETAMYVKKREVHNGGGCQSGCGPC